MNPEQDDGSLADRAAAWVPPWERAVDRETPDDSARSNTESDPDAGDEAALDRDIDADIVREADLPGLGTVEVDAAEDAEAIPAREANPEPETDANPEPEADADPAPEADVDADPEPDVVGSAGTYVDHDDIVMPGPSPLPGLAGAELGGALEAILMVVDEPVTEAQLADVLDVAPEDVAERLAVLATEYAESGRGFELRRAAGGWRFYTRGEYSGYVERFVLDGQSARLTQAALETLAVVAYQQPVTRSRISAIRGVNCDGVVRTLVTRGLLEESGTQPETGAYLYRTTNLFLEKLGLDSVDELPPLAPFLPDDVNGLTDAQR